jgi:hypothetical protein
MPKVLRQWLVWRPLRLKPCRSPAAEGIFCRLEGPRRLIKIGLVFSKFPDQLAALDRHERRALSRRKFAIRAFDLARTQELETGGEVTQLRP